MNSMKDKMHTGELYLPNDEEIAAEQEKVSGKALLF